jgi:hypothetical protein
MAIEDGVGVASGDKDGAAYRQNSSAHSAPQNIYTLRFCRSGSGPAIRIIECHSRARLMSRFFFCF